MVMSMITAEVDRVLKRVAEGVEQFDEQYKKIQATTNLAHKEKRMSNGWMELAT